MWSVDEDEPDEREAARQLEVTTHQLLKLYTGELPPTAERLRRHADASPAGRVALGFATGHGLYGLEGGWPRAVELYRAAASTGQCATAYKLLASCHRNGLGVPTDDAAAERATLQAAGMGDVECMFNAGLDAANAGRETEALGWYRRGSKAGSAPCMVNLALMAETGTAMPQSWTEAIRLYRTAAMTDPNSGLFGCGDAVTTAALNLANCYENGWGVSVSHDDAVRWLQRAAKLGSAEANFRLGCKYEHGEGVPRTLTTACTLYKMAADECHPAAVYNLANCLRNGWGCEVNTQAAHEMFRLAHKLGVSEAADELHFVESMDAMRTVTEDGGIGSPGVVAGGDVGARDEGGPTSGHTPSHSFTTPSPKRGPGSPYGFYTRAPRTPPCSVSPLPHASKYSSTVTTEFTPLLQQSQHAQSPSAAPINGKCVKGVACPTCDGALVRELYRPGDHNAPSYEECWECDVCSNVLGAASAASTDASATCCLCMGTTKKPKGVPRVYCHACRLDICASCVSHCGGSTLKLRKVLAHKGNVSAAMLLAKHYTQQDPSAAAATTATTTTAALANPNPNLNPHPYPQPFNPHPNLHGNTQPNSHPNPVHCVRCTSQRVDLDRGSIAFQLVHCHHQHRHIMPLILLTGYPGVGKTTCIQAMLRVLIDAGHTRSGPTSVRVMGMVTEEVLGIPEVDPTATNTNPIPNPHPNPNSNPNPNPDPMAKQVLLDFARVTLNPGESTVVTFNPPTWQDGRSFVGLSVVDRHGLRSVVPHGDYALVASVTGGQSVGVATVRVGSLRNG
eukprot:m.106679 g.106679  ORF g.106679 m.106679 type:complete len:791 (-) comp10599_c0_seq2:193-2565(-)